MKRTTRLRKIVGSMLNSIVLFASIFFFSPSSAFAQSVPCPPNFDFEQGNYGNWKYETGYSCIGTPSTGVTFGTVQSGRAPGNGLGFPIPIPATNPNPTPWAYGGPLSPGPSQSNYTGNWARFDTTSALISPNDTDYYGGFKINHPGGGNYAMQIGDDTPYYAAERMTYYVHVPVGFNDYSFTFRYAVVLFDGGHLPAEQPT